jgi:hypothetical protein
MRFSKLLFVCLIALLPLSSYAQAVVPQGWGCAYNDNMNSVSGSSGDVMEHDMYITFVRCVDNKAIQKDADYNSIPSSVYADIWICNKQSANLNIGAIKLSITPSGPQTDYTKEISNDSREHWIIKDPLVISPYEIQNASITIGLVDAQNPNNFRLHSIKLVNMFFPQSFMISEAPPAIDVKSESDITISVSNSMSYAISGLALPAPDAVALYFYTKKQPNKSNAFKTPVTTVPTVGGAPFTFVYPGKYIKSDYEASYFDIGEGAAVVKAAKSYPLQLNFKDAYIDANVKCLVTLVNKAEKTYQYVP